MSNTKTKINILAMETSCDETSAAVVEVQGESGQWRVNSGDKILSTRILSNVVASQIKIHQKYGGVFPEKASRAHSEKIVSVVEESLKVAKIKLNNVDLIAVTSGPGLIGSLLIGVNFAKTLSYSTGIPIMGVNHWLGHVYSCFAGENSKFEIRNSKLPKFPILALIVSGGHTGLVLMKSHNEIQTLGQTLDDAAGEAFDKVAKLLHLPYPGGPAIAACAAKIRNSKSEIRNLHLPRPMLDSGDYNFSFSGLKTAVLYKIKDLESQSITINHYKSQLAFEFQQAVIDILVGKTIRAALEFKPKSILLCGGVSANKKLRNDLQKAVSELAWRPQFHVPPLDLTGDNAAMIGIAAAYHLDKKTTWSKIHANSNEALN